MKAENPVTMYNAHYEGSNDKAVTLVYPGFKENVDVSCARMEQEKEDSSK